MWHLMGWKVHLTHLDVGEITCFCPLNVVNLTETMLPPYVIGCTACVACVTTRGGRGI